MMCRDADASLSGWMAFTSLIALVACGGGTLSLITPYAVRLSVSTTGSGQVVSNPEGLDCTSSCEAFFGAGSTVTLKATPGENYQFDSWSNGCTGTDTKCVLTLTEPGTVTAHFAPLVPVADAPFVDYTDIVSGPIDGGEKDQGTYLSIFGTNFGKQAGLGSDTQVFIGGVEVANYRYLGPSQVSARPGPADAHRLDAAED